MQHFRAFPHDENTTSCDCVLPIHNRVVPLDNFMIYKDIIRLDRPD